MPEAVIVSAVRTPVGRSGRGAFATTRPDDLAASAVTAALNRIPTLDAAEIDDIILGCAMPEAERAGMSPVPSASVPASPSISPASLSIAFALPASKPSPRPPSASKPAWPPPSWLAASNP